MTALGAKQPATAQFSTSDFQHGAEIQNETLPGLGAGRLNSRFRENGTEDSRRAALTQAAARRRGSRGQSPLALRYELHVIQARLRHRMAVHQVRPVTHLAAMQPV